MNPSTKLHAGGVLAMIKSTTYTRTPSGKAIVCELVLDTGAVCLGVARVIDLENYDEHLGKDAARAKAVQEVFDYAAARMQESIHTGSISSKHKELMAEYMAANNNQPTVV